METNPADVKAIKESVETNPADVKAIKESVETNPADVKAIRKILNNSSDLRIIRDRINGILDIDHSIKTSN